MRDLPVDDARARMLAKAVRTPIETIALDDCAGRVLAEPVIAARDQPPFDASAMDGWAVRGEGPRLRIAGESAAGHGYRSPLGVGEAVRIFTGAPVPAGAERVVIQEEAERDGEALTIAAAAGAPRFIRPRGGDFRQGAMLLEPGQRLDPWRMALAAAAGRATLAVSVRPTVVLLATGEEIVLPGAEPGPDQIFESAGPALATLARRWGASPRALKVEGDHEDAIAAAVAGSGGDLVVTVGGASVGDHDLVKPALARLGLALEVETVRLRPGKPTWFGTLADGRRVLGLPGNPASALVCAELFLKPLLMAMQGADPSLTLARARLAAPLPAAGPREHWARARLAWDEAGLAATPMTDQDSSLVTIFAQAGGLIRQAAGSDAQPAGAMVNVLMLDRL
jgi:molybdopterin molybdotransferase